MPRHITVDRVPLCCVHYHEFGGIQQMFNIEEEVWQQGGHMICMPDPDKIEVTVQVMRSLGLNAEIVDGTCPEFYEDRSGGEL